MAPVNAPEVETVAVVGAGAMGGMYAAHFAAAGFDVVLVASGDRARRLREDGLIVNGKSLRARVVDPDVAADRGPADLVLVAVKDRQLAEAIEQIAPLVGEHTTILSVLNGLDSEEALAATYGAQRVLLCVAAAMDAQRVGNRVTYRQAGRLTFGPAQPGDCPDRVAAVQRALDRADLAWHTPDDMRHAMWWKFMVNVGINQACAVLRAPYGTFQVDGPARALMQALQEEVIAVAAAEGVELGAADLDSWHEVLAGQPVDGWPSTLQDVEAGRPTEVDILAGRVVTLGERHGIPTPYNQAMLWTLRDRTDRKPLAPLADSRSTG